MGKDERMDRLEERNEILREWLRESQARVDVLEGALETERIRCQRAELYGSSLMERLDSAVDQVQYLMTERDDLLRVLERIANPRTVLNRNNGFWEPVDECVQLATDVLERHEAG
jgi:chromosome segregation ATPase